MVPCFLRRPIFAPDKFHSIRVSGAVSLKEAERLKSRIEAEGVKSPFVVKADEPHSSVEGRYYVLGKTDKDRLLFIVFTIRRNKIRVISARDINRKEKKIYEQIEKDAEIQE